jgi:hypothetical protein
LSSVFTYVFSIGLLHALHNKELFDGSEDKPFGFGEDEEISEELEVEEETSEDKPFGFGVEEESSEELEVEEEISEDKPF